MKINLWRKLIRSNFFIKLLHWEYWPFGIVQFPFILYWLYLSLKARSIVFFSLSNPGIPMGGMFGESKFDILEKIPSSLKPKSVFIQLPTSTEEVVNALNRNGYQFPVIFKPDLGERGFMVKRIDSENDITEYLKKIKINFIVQELIDLPLEFGVFYRRYPNEKFGEVTSIVMKEMLSVEGDGTKTLEELILEKDRAKLQLKTLSRTFSNQWNSVPAKGEKIELVSIGNHCLGTKFIDGCDLINPTLNISFDKISKQIEGFYFGRFDLRCNTLADLENGVVKIMELNGCGAEPSHIYHPGFPLSKAMSVMYRHWNDMYRVSIENKKKGLQYISIKESHKLYKNFKNATLA